MNVSMDLRPGMINFGIGLPGVEAIGQVANAFRTIGKARNLRKAWDATMTAGHLAQAGDRAQPVVFLVRAGGRGEERDQLPPWIRDALVAFVEEFLESAFDAGE